MKFWRIVYIAVVLMTAVPYQMTFAADNTLLDWKTWQAYRNTVQHPTLSIKAADVVRAHENIKRYPWAQNYQKSIEGTASVYLDKLTPEFLENMIPETTPGDSGFTPCPACREQGKPGTSHGLWTWTPSDPDHLKCQVCGTVFPNERYPESVVLQTHWGKPQTLTFYGGEPFQVFAYKTGRPSFTGNIRARKVAWSGNLCRQMAEAYVLTGNVAYARACRLILLRFSVVYPNWLVHVGYGEYADMDPHVAAFNVNSLPTPELCYPPNQRNNNLYTGYWTAGRSGGTGMDGVFVSKVTEAYDLTCTAQDAGKPLYSDDDRKKIEHDLLLEGTVLLAGDTSINNKSVGNRAAAALVGMCVGHPGLVRFGLEGFTKTVDDWFLPDGGTPESAAYATMTLGGVDSLGQAFRGYSDPPGYTDGKGQHLEKIDLYHGTQYSKVWEAMFATLQGNLLYPPLADSYRTTGIGLEFVELMVANYPERSHYLSLLQALSGPELSKGYVYAPTAIYYREPGLETRPVVTLKLPEVCLPDLRQGYMRTGADGRDSLLLLNASHWGNHHHEDSLNLYYWKAGYELLSDLGYLWDHPHKDMTDRTLAHNLVIIDEKDQATKERGGDVQFFKAEGHVKAMQASSKAYPQAQIYNRTSVLVDHGESGSYAVDFFRVQGGTKQDYVLHGPNNDYVTQNVNLTPIPAPLYDFKNIRTASGDAIWSVTWKLDPKLNFTTWNVGRAGEQVFLGDGWGQRDYKNSDIGATLPYIVRRTEGSDTKTFVSLFEGYAPDKSLVRSVNRLTLPATLNAPPEIVSLTVETTAGHDYIVSTPETTSLKIPTPDGILETSGRLTVVSVDKGKALWSFSEGTTPIRFNGAIVGEGSTKQ